MNVLFVIYFDLLRLVDDSVEIFYLLDLCSLIATDKLLPLEVRFPLLARAGTMAKIVKGGGHLGGGGSPSIVTQWIGEWPVVTTVTDTDTSGQCQFQCIDLVLGASSTMSRMEACKFF